MTLRSLWVTYREDVCAFGAASTQAKWSRSVMRLAVILARKAAR